jgi:hypothetical protein
MNPEQEYHQEMSTFLSRTVLRQEEPQETPQRIGHGSVDGGAHGPEPRRQKTESDHLLDMIFDGDHHDGVSWTTGRGDTT